MALDSAYFNSVKREGYPEGAGRNNFGELGAEPILLPEGAIIAASHGAGAVVLITGIKGFQLLGQVVPVFI